MTVATNLSPRPGPAGSAVPRRRAVLTIVPVTEAASSRAPFVVAVVSLLVAGLIGLLVLNTVLGKDSFHLHELRQEARLLADTEQALTREVEALRAPSALAEKALEMGMVQAGPPAFLRLSDGAVLGSGEPAQAPLLEEGAEGAAAAADGQQPSSAAADDTSTEPGADASTDETTDATADESTDPQ